MNGPVLNDRDGLEQQLADQLHRRAAESGGGDDAQAWDAIHERIRHRHHVRQVRRTVGTLAAMVVLVAGLFSMVNRNVNDDGVGLSPAASTPEQAPAPGENPASLPRLVVALPGYEITHASEYIPGVDEPTPPPSIPPTPRTEQPSSDSEEVRLSVLTEPGRGYDGRVLFVAVVPASTPYGFGEHNPQATQVDIGGATAYLSRYTEMPANSLGWKTADGRGLHLVGLRLSEEEMITAGQALQLGIDGTVAWREGAMPAGLTLLRTTSRPVTQRQQAEVVSTHGGDRLDLRLQAGDQAVLDDLIRDRAAGALEIGETKIDGEPAVMSVYEQGDETSLMWMVRPGVVAELVGSGSARADLIAAAESLREIDETEWIGLRAKYSVDAQ